MFGSSENIGAAIAPAKSRQHRAKAEHDHEQAFDIDAQGADHLGVSGPSADQHANARSEYTAKYKPTATAIPTAMTAKR